MNTVNWKSWAALVRLPNVFTVIADVSAAYLLILGGSGWYTGRLGIAGSTSDQQSLWIIFTLALLSVISLYWAGMILNDLFDLPRDLQDRPERPLASRAISVKAARRAGFGLLIMGVLPTIGIGLSSNSSVGWVPAVIAVLLAVCIVLYDGPFKRTPIAPVLMGGCRSLSFLLGATAANAALDVLIGADSLANNQSAALGPTLFAGLTPVVLAFALGMGIYIAGLTTFGRREAIGDRSIHLPVGLVGMVIGTMLLAWAPRLASFWQELDGPSWMRAWRVDPVVVFPAAILLMLATTLLRARAATMNPSPSVIQATIGSGLLAIIPIAAAITMLAVGAKIAVVVFALLIPSRILASKFRMT
jgi:4-hydroxybenzoate polyprenyltransferase